ncbi:MAG: bacteriocin [Pseudomonadales bacterium]|jgi:bacteriocin-like protein|nr:bacteriocin [Pseudomonadales bacterium]
MRELTEKELEQVSGGNPYAILSLASAYATGEWAGNKVNSFVNRTFSMSTGEAAYHTFNSK